MLNILEFNLTGLFSYGLQQTIRLNKIGLVELTGINKDRLTITANGSGKTSVLNGISHLLFGENPVGATDTTIVNSVWTTGVWSYIKYINSSGKQYRVIYTRSWKTNYPDEVIGCEPSTLILNNEKYLGTDLYFEEWNGSVWLDKRCPKMLDTRKAIRQSLQISYEQFLTTSYLAQQSTVKFITGKNKDRINIISEFLDLSIWDKCIDKVQKRITEILMARERLTSGIVGKRQLLSSLPKVLSAGDLSILQSDLLNLENNKITTEKQIDEIKRSQNKLNAIINEYNTQKISIQINNRTIYQEYSLKEKELNQIKFDKTTILSNISNRKIDLAQYYIAEGQHKNEIDNIDIILANYSINNICNHCGSLITVETYEKYKLDLLNRKHGLENKLERIYDIISGLIDEHREQIKIDHDIESKKYDQLIENKNIDIKNILDKISSLNAEENSINDNLEECKQNNLLYKNKLYVEETYLVYYLSRINEINKTISTNQERADTIATTEFSISNDEHEIENLNKEMKILNVLIKAMGDRGIKAHKFGSIISILNKYIDEYISILTNNQVKVWFTPWREKQNAKTDNDIITELSILVKEGPKSEIDLSLYSGAERQQITLAIMLGFWKLAKLKSGGSNVLFLDEIFGSFDLASAGLVVDLLHNLKGNDIGTIIVVTHDDRIKQLIDYNKRWIVTKYHHISTLREEI